MQCEWIVQFLLRSSVNCTDFDRVIDGFQRPNRDHHLSDTQASLSSPHRRLDIEELTGYWTQNRPMADS
jgi:hypothetical protein